MILNPCNDQAQRARVCLALTCGLPGAGKTSLCNAISAYSKPDLLVRHICFDNIIEVDPKDEVQDFTNAGTFKVKHAMQHCMMKTHSCNSVEQIRLQTRWHFCRPIGTRLYSRSSSACWRAGLQRMLIKGPPLS